MSKPAAYVPCAYKVSKRYATLPLWAASARESKGRRLTPGLLRCALPLVAHALRLGLLLHRQDAPSGRARTPSSRNACTSRRASSMRARSSRSAS